MRHGLIEVQSERGQRQEDSAVSAQYFDQRSDV